MEMSLWTYWWYLLFSLELLEKDKYKLGQSCAKINSTEYYSTTYWATSLEHVWIFYKIITNFPQVNLNISPDLLTNNGAGKANHLFLSGDERRVSGDQTQERGPPSAPVKYLIRFKLSFWNEQKEKDILWRTPCSSAAINYVHLYLLFVYVLIVKILWKTTLTISLAINLTRLSHNNLY
jgi:hypothetical protein